MPKTKDNKKPANFIGRVEQREVVDEMRTSYLDYAMSVIVARALPDVRDGLKPVQRRILVTTHDLGLTAKAKHRKSAKIAGDVSGNYHPHGESNVYPAMVRLAQDFSMRYPLIDGQGNFGSIDGDEAAAMRYTEARMTSFAELMLADIEKETVPYVDNYDNTRQEPSVLPAALPQLLLNGTLGIAVGMASNIPPHNIGEVIDGVTATIDNPDIELDGLMEYVKGPDFPTGAHIYGIEGIKQAYATGRGRVDIRGVAEIEENQGRSRIVITEIPYQVNKSELVLKVAELVRTKKLEGISDIRDESDRTGLRVVIELKRSAYPKKVLNRLYSLTTLQTAFHINTVALVDGIEPRTLSLKEIIQHFIDHRVVVVTKRSEYDLARAQERAHLLEGLIKALDHIDEVVAIIRASKTREEAHKKLVAKFSFSNEQTVAILDMRLATLVGLEHDRLAAELKEKQAMISYLQSILADKVKLMAVIKGELVTIKEKYTDKRRTKIFKQGLGSFTAEDLIPNESVLVTLTKTNYIKRVPVTEYKSQGRGGKGVLGMSTKEQDSVWYTKIANTHDDILFFTDQGRIFKTKVYELPTANRQAKGNAIANVIQIAPGETVTAVIAVEKGIWSEESKYLSMGTLLGTVKKTAVSQYKNVRSTGIKAISLKNDDQLRWVNITSSEDLVMQVTIRGQAIVYQEADVRPMGRSAAGVRGIRLRERDEVVSTTVIQSAVKDQSELLIVTGNGFGKRTEVKQFPLQKRGGVGIKAANVTGRTGPVVSAQVVTDEKSSVVITSERGQVIKTMLKQVKKLGRVTQGVVVMRLKKDDKVASVAIMEPEEAVIEPETVANNG